MASTGKSFSMLLILLLVGSSGSLLFKPTSAESIPQPSVPEFTATLISPSLDSHSVNRTIELSIQNQPFISNYGFFYNVRARINDANWSILYTIDDVPTQSNGQYTTLSYPSDQPVVEYQYSLGDRIENLFAGDRIEFQVQAMVGSIHRVFNPNFTNQLDMYPYEFTGQTSNWSNTQTITIPATSTSPNQTATVPEFSSLTSLSLLASLPIVLVIQKKKAKTSRL